MEAHLKAGDEDGELIRAKLLVRMGDISEFMKGVKQRFSVWYNRHNKRYGTLWSERFKSVLVQGQGNPLQTMAAYIDLNPVRAGIVDDPKDYRFCGYAEAVAGNRLAAKGLLGVWGYRIGGCLSDSDLMQQALTAHRMLIFGKGASPWTHKGRVIDREKALQVLESERGELSMAAVLRCRVRYFTDGAIFGSAEFVRGFTESWQTETGQKRAPEANAMPEADWGDLAVIRRLRKRVFS